jgi:hypothetical protein
LSRPSFLKPSLWISSLAICVLAFSTLTATSAQSITSCPEGWVTKDQTEVPIYCDKLILDNSSVTVPAGVTSISVMAFGGGGGGGGGGQISSIPKAGGGGGAGEITQASLTVVRDEVLTITIGAGGNGGFVTDGSDPATDGGDGSTTTVRDSTNTVRVSAVGGKGGKSGTNSTNAGDGGASGNSTPADINPGGTGFNGEGRSSGGGGGGFSADGEPGLAFYGGHGGQSTELTGEFGFPVVSNLDMVFNISGHSTRFLYNAWLGHGGGGGVVVKSFSGDFETGAAGQSHIGEPGGNGGGIWYLQCENEGSPCSFQSTDINSAARYPGQGGMGGAGLVAETRQGTAGVAGAVWLRILAQVDGDDGDENGGGNYTPVVETKLNPCQAVSGVENVTRKAKSFSGFAINSAVLTKAMKKEIRSFLRKHPKEVCVSVAGFTMGPRVLSTDAKLAKDRAKAVRTYIKSLRPDAAFTKIKWSTEKRVGNNVRRAKVTLRF